MNEKIRIYCIRRTGKTISGDIFKYIADAALRMFYKEQKRLKVTHGDVVLLLKTKFEDAYYCGFRGTLFDVEIVVNDDIVKASMIGQVQSFENILDDNFEIVDMTPKPPAKKQAKEEKSRIPKPSLN